MKKEIRTVDEKRGIVQVTCVDERWYTRPTTNPATGLPSYEFVPSVTWIVEHYPKGIGFYKWLANTGWDESQAIKEAAGDKGSKVHQAIGEILASGQLPMGASMLNPSTGQMEPLNLEEYEALMSFVAWHETAKPIVIAREIVVWNDQEGYAGTVDLVCIINGQLWIVDFKTSQHIWPSHELQLSAYKHAEPEAWKNAKLMVLQLGYKRNKFGYKSTEIVDQYPLFLHTKAIWAKETAGQTPQQKDYPLTLSITPQILQEPVLMTVGATDDGAAGTRLRQPTSQGATKGA